MTTIIQKEAIILAGGFGTRLQGVLKDLPKPMAPIHGRPFLEYILDWLIGFDYTHVVLSTGYLHEKVEEHFGTSYKGVELSYAHETEPLGTGGAIRFALSHCYTDEALVLNGDTLFRVNLAAFEHFFHEKNCMLAIALREVEEVSRYGSVIIGDDGQIIHFSEKEASEGRGLINGGVYYLSKKIFDKYPCAQKFSFEKELMEKLYMREQFFAMVSNGYFIDIGIPSDYARAQVEL